MINKKYLFKCFNTIYILFYLSFKFSNLVAIKKKTGNLEMKNHNRNTYFLTILLIIILIYYLNAINYFLFYYKKFKLLYESFQLLELV
jgi:hypothetical protein